MLLLKKAILEWVWVDFLSAEKNELETGKALIPSVQLLLLCLALVTQGCMAPETTDRMKMHPNAVQKWAAGEVNDIGQTVFV